MTHHVRTIVLVVARIYKDLNLIFSPHPNTKDVTKKTDIEVVKQSVKNLILTKHYERPFHPEIGSNVTDILFESNDTIDCQLINETDF